MHNIDTLIIGAGPAGLACAGALKQLGRHAEILEKSDSVGSVWRAHYDRLHLHTAKRYSALPGFAMPRSYPRYPSRKQVVEYLDAYAKHFAIAPQFGTEVTKITKDGDHWTVQSNAGVFHARHVIISGGVASFPNIAKWPGSDRFSGPILHSTQYRNPEPFLGQRVLVVGFGNSGGEIALDLAEAGVSTDLCVRSPVNVIPRDVMGIPAQSFSIAERHLPYKLVDLVNGAISRLRTGDISKLGLPKSDKGPVEQIIKDSRIPLIDIGTIARIRDGSIMVRRGIDRIDAGTVHFETGDSAAYDTIIAATGFKPDLSNMLPDHLHLLTDSGAPKSSGAGSGADGLSFCGYKVVPTGHLREIAIEARDIAKAIANTA